LGAIGICPPIIVPYPDSYRG